MPLSIAERPKATWRIRPKRFSTLCVVLTHLGNGGSLAVMRDGKSIDTTMSFTLTAGVPMSTRSGDLDPSVCGYFARTENMTADQFNEIVSMDESIGG